MTDTNDAGGLKYNFEGFSFVRYENFTERLYYRKNKFSDTRFYNLTSILYEEHFYNNSEFYRVVFTNGTIALYNYVIFYKDSDNKATTKIISTPKRKVDGAELKIGVEAEKDIWKTPRPWGALGGFNNAKLSENKGPIEYGSMKFNFFRYERAPFAYARDFIQFTNTDGSFWRQYEIESSRPDAASSWKYMYQNWTIPLNAKSSTFDNNTMMLFNQSCAFGDLPSTFDAG